MAQTSLELWVNIAGHLLTVFAMIGTCIAVIATVRAQITALKESFEAFGARLGKHEDIVRELAGDVQWLVGRYDGPPRPRAERTRVGDLDGSRS